jgi:phosphatidate cytidylyltransferase
VLLPVALGAIYFGGWAYTAMVLIASVLMVHEWNVLTGSESVGLPTVIGAASVVGAGGLVGAFPFSYAVLVILGGAVIAWLAGTFRGRLGVWPALGVLYAGVPCITLLLIRGDGESGRWFALLLFCVVWATDVGAYAAGRIIGGPRLAPRISPKKTWAGLLGGMVCAGASGAALAALGGFMALWLAAGIGAVFALLAQIGDLAESMVKRHFDAKDSGNLIPGHGGILDRVDGLVLTAPALAALIALMGRNLGGTAQ